MKVNFILTTLATSGDIKNIISHPQNGINCFLKTSFTNSKKEVSFLNTYNRRYTLYLSTFSSLPGRYIKKNYSESYLWSFSPCQCRIKC